MTITDAPRLSPTTVAAPSTVAAGDDEVRTLVTRETILAVTPIEGADAIESATVRGWTVVVLKGEFEVGDECLYFEIDSALPMTDPRFAFLAPRGTKTLDDGAVVHRLKTARLRGVYSQGLVIGLDEFPEVLDVAPGADLASLLGVTKYEAELPEGMDIVAEFPTTLASKTTSERAQNLLDAWPLLLAAGPWLATEKVDGVSLTVARDMAGGVHVCSRNYELHDGGTVYWSASRDTGLLDLVEAGEVVQGEIVGPGIKKNPLGLNEVKIVVFAFTRHNISVPRADWPSWITSATLSPRVVPAPVYDLDLPATVEEAVEMVDGIASLVAGPRKAEGVVWHRMNGAPLPELGMRSTLKVISNKYLLKHDS